MTEQQQIRAKALEIAVMITAATQPSQIMQNPKFNPIAEALTRNPEHLLNQAIELTPAIEAHLLGESNKP